MLKICRFLLKNQFIFIKNIHWKIVEIFNLNDINYLIVFILTRYVICFVQYILWSAYHLGMVAEKINILHKAQHSCIFDVKLFIGPKI